MIFRADGGLNCSLSFVGCFIPRSDPGLPKVEGHHYGGYTVKLAVKLGYAMTCRIVETFVYHSSFFLISAFLFRDCPHIAG
jgi:hypothetical protein